MPIEKFLLLADELQLGGVPDAAQSIYLSILDQQPNNRTAKRGIARLHLGRGELQDALTLLESALPDSSPDESAVILEEIATILHRMTKVKEAAISWANASALHYNCGRFDKASSDSWKSFLQYPSDDQLLSMSILSLQNLLDDIFSILHARDDSDFLSLTAPATPKIAKPEEDFPHTAQAKYYYEALVDYANGNPNEAILSISIINTDLPSFWRLKIFRLHAECCRMIHDHGKANGFDKIVIEEMIELGQFSDAKAYAQQNAIMIDWPRAIQLARAHYRRVEWALDAVKILSNETSQYDSFHEIWESLRTDWEKIEAGNLISEIISILNFSNFYNPTLAFHLFELSDGWHPPEKQAYMLENAISGCLHGTTPDYQKAHQLVHRWWHDYAAEQVSTIISRQQEHIEVTNQPLRIGILDVTAMAAFPHYYHSIIAPTLLSLPKSRFSLFLYCQTFNPLPKYLQDDHFTARQINCFEPSGIDTVIQDQLDVLLLINGFVPNAPIQFLAARPAKRMALWMHTYCGYGPELFDAVIVDHAIHTPFHDTILDETAILTRDCPILIEPSAEAPPVTPGPRHHNGYVTFGIFNRPAKVTDHMVTLWSKILDHLPNAKLAFASNYLDNSNVRDNLTAKMTLAGIHPDRIVILPTKENYADRLALHSAIDIALDTYPFNGGMTTFEALWQGVPIITRTDETPLGRSGLSILTSIGLADLAGYDDDAYIALAVALAGNGEKLDQLRATLRDRMRRSPLMDAERYADDFERMMREILALPAERQRPALRN